MIPIDVIRAGGVLGVPTDTVYGLAVDPRSRSAVGRLYELKGREDTKPVALLVADLESVSSLLVVTPLAARLASEHWPGALTLVLEPHVELPRWVGHPADRSVGVRVPDHDGLTAVLRETGPLAVTSANKTGQPPALNDVMAANTFGSGVDLYLPGKAAGGEASTVIDARGEEPIVLRPGPVVV